MWKVKRSIIDDVHNLVDQYREQRHGLPPWDWKAGPANLADVRDLLDIIATMAVGEVRVVDYHGANSRGIKKKISWAISQDKRAQAFEWKIKTGTSLGQLIITKIGEWGRRHVNEMCTPCKEAGLGLVFAHRKTEDGIPMCYYHYRGEKPPAQLQKEQRSSKSMAENEHDDDGYAGFESNSETERPQPRPAGDFPVLEKCKYGTVARGVCLNPFNIPGGCPEHRHHADTTGFCRECKIKKGLLVHPLKSKSGPVRHLPIPEQAKPQLALPAAESLLDGQTLYKIFTMTSHETREQALAKVWERLSRQQQEMLVSHAIASPSIVIGMDFGNRKDAVTISVRENINSNGKNICGDEISTFTRPSKSETFDIGGAGMELEP